MFELYDDIVPCRCANFATFCRKINELSYTNVKIIIDAHTHTRKGIENLRRSITNPEIFPRQKYALNLSKKPLS